MKSNEILSKIPAVESCPWPKTLQAKALDSCISQKQFEVMLSWTWDKPLSRKEIENRVAASMKAVDVAFSHVEASDEVEGLLKDTWVTVVENNHPVVERVWKTAFDTRKSISDCLSEFAEQYVAYLASEKKTIIDVSYIEFILSLK